MIILEAWQTEVELLRDIKVDYCKSAQQQSENLLAQIQGKH